jgi:hypothetical protein
LFHQIYSFEVFNKNNVFKDYLRSLVKYTQICSKSLNTDYQLLRKIFPSLEIEFKSDKFIFTLKHMSDQSEQTDFGYRDRLKDYPKYIVEQFERIFNKENSNYHSLYTILELIVHNLIEVQLVLDLINNNDKVHIFCIIIGDIVSNLHINPKGSVGIPEYTKKLNRSFNRISEVIKEIQKKLPAFQATFDYPFYRFSFDYQLLCTQCLDKLTLDATTDSQEPNSF